MPYSACWSPEGQTVNRELLGRQVPFVTSRGHDVRCYVHAERMDPVSVIGQPVPRYGIVAVQISSSPFVEPGSSSPATTTRLPRTAEN